jgi:inositol transport system substrate-binding protein
MGALLALEQAKKKDKIIVVGVDAIADALEAVKQSRLDATVFQDAEAQGRQAVETALAIVRNQPFQQETYIPFRLVTKENVGQYAK